MTIETDLMTALAAVAGGRVRMNETDEKTARPYVIVRLIDQQPLMTLQGYAGSTKSFFEFESWAETKSSAVTTKLAVQAAIDAVFSTLAGYREDPPESGFDPDSGLHMEPCRYSFWHA
jgi:hypothetical protein